MTVAELIARLQELPQDREVFLWMDWFFAEVKAVGIDSADGTVVIHDGGLE